MPPASSRFSIQLTMPFHTCPVCGKRHEVHPVLDRLSYGNQLTCSPHCKITFTRLVRTRTLGEVQERKKFLRLRQEEN